MEKDSYTFLRERDNGTTETVLFIPPDCSWKEVMGYFASFLEGCGYKGVYRTLEEAGCVE